MLYFARAAYCIVLDDRSIQGPGDGVAVTLDNIKAMLSRDRGGKDLASSQCVFAQAYRQLSDTDPKLLRTVWDGERVFQVSRSRKFISSLFT